MEKREEQRYKNELMVAYAKELIKKIKDGSLEKKSNSIEISDFDLLHFSVEQLVFMQNDLERLLDCYLFAAGNEEIGYHENVMGNEKENISGYTFGYSNTEIKENYHTFKGILFRQIDSVLENSKGEVQRDFFERILPEKEKALKSTAQASKDNHVRYEERKDQIVADYMKEYGLTKDEAFTQFVYLKNYDGRLGVMTEAGIESIGFYMTI